MGANTYLFNLNYLMSEDHFKSQALVFGMITSFEKD